MADFLFNKVSDAVVKDGKTIREAAHEVTVIQDGINEAGEAVKVRAGKLNLTMSQVDQKIEQIEKELAKWKSIKAGIII